MSVVTLALTKSKIKIKEQCTELATFLFWLMGCLLYTSDAADEERLV